MLQKRLAWALFCCYQPSCVVSQQSWFGFFVSSIVLNHPLPPPTPRPKQCDVKALKAIEAQYTPEQEWQHHLEACKVCIVSCKVSIGGPGIYWDDRTAAQKCGFSYYENTSSIPLVPSATIEYFYIPRTTEPSCFLELTQCKGGCWCFLGSNWAEWMGEFGHPLSGWCRVFR